MRVGFKKNCTALVYIIPLLCILAIFVILHIFLKRAEPIFIAQTSNYSNTAFTDLVNKAVIQSAEQNEFNTFFKQMSSDGFTALEADTSKINKIVSKLLIDIQNALNSDYPAKIYIPLGSLTGYSLLYSLGPAIPVEITPISIVNSQIEDEIKEVGINQTCHTINLHIWVKMHYRGYILNERETIEMTVPISQTIISGDVPQYFGDGVAYPAD